MDNLTNMMQKMIELQEHILIELNSIADPITICYDDSFISKNKKLTNPHSEVNDIKINIKKIEYIEKCHFTLSIINNNLQKILGASKQQTCKLQQFSTTIRSNINKTRENHNKNKFINILNSQFSSEFNGTETQCIYDSIKKSIQLKNQTQTDYTLIKSAKLVDSFYVDIPIINSLENINGLFNWFGGNKKYNQGIYMAICQDFIIQVPFPDLISKNLFNFKHKSIICKYKDVNICNSKQIDLSNKYGTEFRNCNYVHLGESFIKIGSDFRCPTLPSFGCHATLEEDINNVSLQDIKTILMNASSDLLLVLLWYSYHKNLGQIIFTNLDKL